MPRTGLTPEEIRKKAIEIAQVQLRRHGFEKLRFSDVAKSIGVSHVALYAHFKDKSELVEAVSQHWLHEIESTLEAVCAGPGDPLKRVQKWYATLHKYKVEKVKRDPEMFKAFDWSAEQKKPSTQRHLRVLHNQIVSLLSEAYDKKLLTRLNPEKARVILSEALVSFYAPRIIVHHLHEKRAALLQQTLETLLAGLR